MSASSAFRKTRKRCLAIAGNVCADESQQLRRAILESLTTGRPHLAVALDTARDFREGILADEESTPTRVALARSHAELALEGWRAASDVRH